MRASAELRRQLGRRCFFEVGVPGLLSGVAPNSAEIEAISLLRVSCILVLLIG